MIFKSASVGLSSDEFQTSQEKAPVMKDLLVSINIKDFDSDSSKPSSLSTSCQSSPLIFRGQKTMTGCTYKSSAKNAFTLRIIRDQDECVFIRFVEMCLSNGCSAVNGCRQNKNITIIHSTPSVIIWRRNKSSIKTSIIRVHNP